MERSYKFCFKSYFILNFLIVKKNKQLFTPLYLLCPIKWWTFVILDLFNTIRHLNIKKTEKVMNYSNIFT